MRSSPAFLAKPFTIAKGIAIPVGGYHFPNLISTYKLGPQCKVSGSLLVARGSFYDGTRTDASYRGRVELTPKVSVEPALSVNWVELLEGRCTTKLAGTRATFTFSPEMLVSALIQYSSSANSLSANVRFRREYRPGSDRFIVYSDGRDTSVAAFPTLVNRSVVVKFTRLVRF